MNPEILKLFYSHTFIDTIISIFLLFFSITFTIYVRNILQLNKILTFYIFLIHTLIFPFYMFFLFSNGTDSLSYFIHFKTYTFNELETGRVFMHQLIFFFDALKLNFYNINYLFSIFSLFSFYLYLKIFEKIEIKDKFNYYFIFSLFCLPSIHFWHMGYSKDTITFICISLIIYEMLKSKTSLVIIIFPIIILYFVRVHVCLIALISITLYYFFNSKKLITKFWFIMFLSFITPYLLSEIFNFTDLKSIFEFLNIFRDLYTQQESTALYSDTNLILKLIYYIFSPNLFSIKDFNLFYLYIAFENTLLIVLFVRIFNIKFLSVEKLKYFSFLIFFSLISLYLFSFVTSNLGVAVRQKWIFLPAIYIFFSASKYKINYK